MNNRDYWAQREAEALNHYITDEAEYSRHIQAIYDSMLDSVQREINTFYARYASAEGITLAEAKKRVSQADIAEYERRAARYVRDKDFSARANEELRLYNAMMRINRLEMLKANIGLETIAGHDELEKYMAGILQGRTMEELERQAGILGKTIRNNAAKANAIVNGSFKNGTFSDRIWQYQDAMREDLGKLLQTGLIQGKNPRALAADLRKYWYGPDPRTGGGAKYCMERLMRTELARVQTEAQRQSFVRNGFDKYLFIVNRNCCDICKEVAKKDSGYGKGIYLVEEMQPGLNASPIHPHCRCSTAAYEDDDEYDAWLDHLANGGTTAEWEAMNPDDIISFNKATNMAEAVDFAQNMLGVEQIDAFGADMNLNVANAVNEAIFKISNEFGSLTEYGYLRKISTSDAPGSYARYYRKTSTMTLNGAVRHRNAISILTNDALGEFAMGAWSTGSPYHTIYHELGHAVYYMMTDSNPTTKNRIGVLYSSKYSDILGSETIWDPDDELVGVFAKEAQNAGLSFIGLRNEREFVAEAIAQYYLSDDPSELSKEIIALLLEG